MREEAIRQKFADASSADPDDKDYLANCQTNTADVLRRSGRFHGAIAASESALAIREPLVAAHPEFAFRPRRDLPATRAGAIRHGNLPEAAAAWKRAAHYDGSKTLFANSRSCGPVATPAWRDSRAGRAQGCPQRMGRNRPKRAWPCCARQSLWATATPGDYLTESALDPLRDRPDFRLMMMDLVFPTEPFAPATESAARQVSCYRMAIARDRGK